MEDGRRERSGLFIGLIPFRRLIILKSFKAQPKGGVVVVVDWAYGNLARFIRHELVDTEVEGIV